MRRRHGNKELDLSLPVRLSGLPNNARLTLKRRSAAATASGSLFVLRASCVRVFVRVRAEAASFWGRSQ